VGSKRKIIRNGKPNPARRNNYKRTDNEESAVGVGSKLYQKALQLRDKYRELAREALVGGDRVTAEGHFQHADHYNRIISAAHEIEEEKTSNNSKVISQEAPAIADISGFPPPLEEKNKDQITHSIEGNEHFPSLASQNQLNRRFPDRLRGGRPADGACAPPA
jgi:hypothetical protein